MTMRKLIIFFAAALMTVACSDPNQKLVYEGIALGLPQADYVVETAAGTLKVDVISNTEYNISSDSYWLTLPAKGQGREGFEVAYDENDGVARVAMVKISVSETYSDTLYIRQKGAVVPSLELEESSLSLSGSASGNREVGLTTNLRDDEIVVKTIFEEGSAWISDVKVENSVLSFKYEANALAHMRKAQIQLIYVDESGFDAVRTVYINQKNDSDAETATVTIAELRSTSSAAPSVIEDDMVLEGIVVSNRESGNMGDNTQFSMIGIDYSMCQRTVYVESLDGSCGIMLITEAEEDNVFKQFDKVRISLRGRTLCRSTVIDADKDPVYCWIEGVKATDVLSVEHGAAAPLKEKYISELTDDDIFTYVTLKDCELPFRKGSLTPVNEKLTNAAAVNKVNKFAISLHDIEGSSIYVYTNTTCPYRRDGHRLPYGSGKMKGVIVHELYSRFIYQDNNSGDEDTYGNIGRYQIRHTSLDDFAMAQDRSEADFSAILAEWRYILAASQEKYYATDGDKTAFFTHSCKNSITLYDDFSYLGPVGTNESGFFGKNPGNINGLGVILEEGTDWMGPDFSGQNSENAYKVNNTSNGMGAGISPSGIGAAWYTNVNWDTNEKKPAGLILKFSTQDVNTSKMSIHIALMSVISSNGVTGPRLYNVDWSLDGTSWTTADEFWISDYAGATGVPVTQLWQTAGYIPVTVELPAAQLSGKETVWLRIFPHKDMIIGSYTEYITTTTVTNSYPRTAFNYIGIRYNK